MSVPKNPQVVPNGKNGIRVKPKPYSIERRFRLMQAGTITIVILLILSVLYWNFSVQARLRSSLQTLHSTLALNGEIDASHYKLVLVFWETYNAGPASSRSNYEERVREANGLLERYDSIPLSNQEQEAVVRLRSLHRDFLALTAR
jgi:hypothetical protein